MNKKYHLKPGNIIMLYGEIRILTSVYYLDDAKTKPCLRFNKKLQGKIGILQNLEVKVDNTEFKLICE